jgi:hypothetical protein
LDAFSSVVTLLLAQPDSKASSAAQHRAQHENADGQAEEPGAPIPDCWAVRAAMMGPKSGAMEVRMFLSAESLGGAESHHAGLGGTSC